MEQAAADAGPRAQGGVLVLRRGVGGCAFLVRGVGGVLRAPHGLETWEFDVLSALRRQGAPYQLSPGSLLHATLVTSGTMTNRIDRLTEGALVSRLPDPHDKRGVLVQLTDRGREVGGPCP